VSVRVLLVDDHAEVLLRIKSLLSSDFDVVGTASDGAGMVTAAAKLNPDVIVADITMPGLNGLEASREVLKRRPELPIIMLTMHREPGLVREALDAGVRGYIHKLRAGEELVPAILGAVQGQTFVSPDCLPEVQQV